jgi:hypothetical protein
MHNSGTERVQQKRVTAPLWGKDNKTGCTVQHGRQNVTWSNKGYKTRAIVKLGYITRATVQHKLQNMCTMQHELQDMTTVHERVTDHVHCA